MKTPTKVNSLRLECSCVNISSWKWADLMEGATKANHRIINKLVKKHLPDLWEDLCLWCYNPYNYFKTKTHLILVHSSIEYFLRYEE